MLDPSESRSRGATAALWRLQRAGPGGCKERSSKMDPDMSVYFCFTIIKIYINMYRIYRPWLNKISLWYTWVIECCCRFFLFGCWGAQVGNIPKRWHIWSITRMSTFGPNNWSYCDLVDWDWIQTAKAQESETPNIWRYFKWIESLLPAIVVPFFCFKKDAKWMEMQRTVATSNTGRYSGPSEKSSTGEIIGLRRVSTSATCQHINLYSTFVYPIIHKNRSILCWIHHPSTPTPYLGLGVLNAWCRFWGTLDESSQNYSTWMFIDS